MLNGNVIENMGTVVTQTKRIEYIDALRGFTMILVVLHHVSLMGFGVESTLGKWLVEFRMPLFFFISGFVLYKPSQVWNISSISSFLKKKFPIQILSPFIFFSIYVYVFKKDFIVSLVDPTKVGYWFTFMLFAYYLLYIVCQLVFDKIKLNSYIRDCALVGIGLLVFVLAYGASYLFIAKNNLWMGFIGGANLKYFLFFGCGTLVKKHFKKFECLLDFTPLILVSVSVYFLMNIFYEPINGAGLIARVLFILTTACTGILLVFGFFRKYQQHFNAGQPVGSLLQAIGRRTLDIYLLHYFFIPEQLGEAFPIFSEYNLPIIEFICSLIIAFLVIVVCLGISAVLRISPTLGHFLFGAKT